MRIVFDKLGLLVPVLIGVQLVLGEDLDLDVHLEQLLHGVLDVGHAAALDDVLTELGGGIENQLLIRQLHHLGVVKPGGNDRGGQPVFHMRQNLGPDIGGRVHNRLLSVGFLEKSTEIRILIQPKL